MLYKNPGSWPGQLPAYETCHIPCSAFVGEPVVIDQST